MPLGFYLDGIEKKGANPSWDGDGVQGAGQSRDRRGRWARRGGAAAALVGVAMGTVAFAGHLNAEGRGDIPQFPSSSSSTSAQTKTIPDKPAPTTAKGFQKMWNNIDTDEWGAADVSLSVAMPDGRSVWLYGDTISGNNGFVHSSGITQDGGNLHVSNGGAQLLPNDPDVDGRKSIYWIEQAKAVGGNKIEVTAAPMSIGSENSWDFKRRDERSRVASVVLDKIGNLKFVKWLRYVKAPAQYNDFKVIGDHHFTYENRAHPEFRMKSGKVLMTVNQNWDDGTWHTNPDGTLKYEDYRPIFYEGSGDEIRKGNPLWDGDGVQGAGQPRDRLGRWVSLPGPSSISRIGAWEMEDGTFGVFTDKKRNPVKTYKTKAAANKHVRDAIRADRDQYVAEYKPPKPPARVATKVTERQVERLPVPGRPTLDQANKATAHARRNYPDAEAKYAGLIVRLLKNKGVTQDPSRRGEIHDKYGITPKRQVEIETEMYGTMFPNGTKKPKSAPKLRTTKQSAAMERQQPLSDGILPLSEDGKKSFIYRNAKGEHVVTNREGKTRSATADEIKFFDKARKYRREQRALLDAHNDSVAAKKQEKIVAAQRWAKSEGLDPDDSYWWAFFWNDPSLLKNEKDESAVPMRVNLAPVEGNRRKMDPAILERLLAMPDMDSRKMRGHKPDSKKSRKGDDDFVEAGDKSREVDPEWESRNEDRRAKHSSRIARAYQNYMSKHPGSKMTLAQFTDLYYNNKIRIPGGKRVSKRRKPNPEFDRETAKIRENKKTWGEKVHKFKAAEWTHPNGHPRCILCGAEESISPECNREPTQAEHDAFQRKMDIEFGRVEKKAANPFWDGDGVQGVGQPRGYHGRWVRTPGRSAFSKIGVWAHDDGSYGVYADGDNLVSTHKKARDADLKAARIVEQDRGASSDSVFDHSRKSIGEGQKIKRPQKGASHNNKLGDGTPVKRRRHYEPENAYYLRNNGDTKISDKRLREIYEDRSKVTAQEFDLLQSAAGDVAFDGDKLIPFRAVREGGAQRKMERYMMMKNLRTQLAQDFAKEKGKGTKGAGGQILIHGTKDKRAVRQRELDNKKRQANQRNFVNRETKQQMLDDFGDGTRAKCIFCGKPVRIDQVSPERMKPGPIGGKYERGNMAPSHVSCNNRHGTMAQRDPEAYFENMIAKFLKVYGPEIEAGKLKHVRNKHRGKFSRRAA